MTRYVLGFLFSSDYKSVVLLEKQRPDWQAGFLNGFGGQYDAAAETPHDALRRTFEKEIKTVVVRPTDIDWNQYATLYGHHDGDGWEVDVFRGIAPDDRLLHEVRGYNERVWVYLTEKLPMHLTLPDLRWLIPMAFDVNARFDIEVTRQW